MFSIFDASSFTNINRKPTPPESPKSDATTTTTTIATTFVNTQEPRHNGFQQKHIKTHNIVGTRFRSKTGCLNCRKRKYVRKP